MMPFRSLLFLPLVALVPVSAFSLGIRIADQNPQATARGNAFTATADNPSAIYYNPAGITQLEGTRALLGAYAVTIETDVDLDAGASFSSTNDDWQVAPQFFATWKAKQYPIALGLGVY
ncbi:MAG TPA: outer membrane protein transport protein, partial [Chthoniobacteraceae bacterium]|nr:outer membrane protein transport protein [Chthoniobacteraceae bacterium]